MRCNLSFVFLCKLHRTPAAAPSFFSSSAPALSLLRSSHFAPSISPTTSHL